MGIREVDGKLAKIYEDFLDNRMVRSETVEREMQKGCPQVSSLGPTLWNLAMGTWFQMLNRAHNKRWEQQAHYRQVEIEYVAQLPLIQAYADDKIVAIPNALARKIEAKRG